MLLNKVGTNVNLHINYIKWRNNFNYVCALNLKGLLTTLHNSEIWKSTAMVN